MDSLAYDTLVQKLLGRRAVWVTPSKIVLNDRERRLLDNIGKNHTPRAMPPGVLPTPTKKKVRPSSASANIQSHPVFTSGLYDNGRPSTAAPGRATPPGGVGGQARPKTQAGGPRFWGRNQMPDAVLKPQRRLTLGHVDGIAETEAANRPGAVGQVSLGQAMKGKVRYILLLVVNETLIC